ncbi:MAG: DoxX family protein [Solirubrobacterales bacterium]
MVVATVIASVLLAALLAFSAIRKLTHQERIVQGYLRAGVPEDKLDYLAIILLAGAAGLVLGLFWAPIGVAAAIGVICYFLVAVAFHIRADDAENLPTPLVIALIATLALILRVATL